MRRSRKLELGLISPCKKIDLIPATSNPATLTLPQIWDGVMMITVHPDHVDAAAMKSPDSRTQIKNAIEQRYTLPA
jgi:hypothetical protein